MAKVEGQVFNICHEREATGRVFPSGPWAGAVVTAACLPGPPVSNDVLSREPEISGKAEPHLPGLVDFWKQNSQLSSGLALILCSCSESKHHENRSRNHSGNRHRTSWRTSTCVIATIYRAVCCETDI